jgi:protein O-GlcNAc transferase
MASTPDPSLLIAQAHLAARRMAEAEAVLRGVLKRDPHSAIAYTFLGQALRAQKRIDEAIPAFQRAVEIEPQSAGAYANLGNALYAAGRIDAAIDSYRRAIQLQPDFADVCNNLAAALRSAGRLDEAIAHFKQAATMRPGFAMPLTNLGAVLYSCGRYQEAADAYRQSLAIAEADPEVHNLLGNTLLNLQKPAEAMVCFERAMALRPDFAEPWNNRANALRMLGRLEESIEAYRRAIAVRPDLPEPYCNMSTPLMMLGRTEEAMAALRCAIALRPTLVEAHCKLGAALLLQSDPDSAAAAGEQALRIQPDYASPHNLLGDAWKERGRIDLAVEEFRKAVDLGPTFVTAHDSLVYSILFDPAYNPPRILAEHAKWNRQHALRFRDSWRAFKNDRNPDRRLRIGYVSPDFRDHVIGRNILPVLSRHDSEAIEVFCYSSVIQPDGATERFRTASSVFREVAYLGDDACADLIRSDQIDILVDLTLHLLGNRLGVFARKPAPVQVTWAGYPGTTGVGAIDYRLTDPYLDPPGEHDGHYSEQSWRLRDTFWCYDPLGSQTPVADLPAGRNGYITFGCLNNPCKINQFTLKLWARAMRDVPGSRLILAAQSGSAGAGWRRCSNERGSRSAV